MCDGVRKNYFNWDQRIPNEPILKRQFVLMPQTPMMLSMRPVSTCGTGRAAIPFPVDNNMIPGSKYNVGVDSIVKPYRPYFTNDCLPENYWHWRQLKSKNQPVNGVNGAIPVPVWDINTSRKLAQRDTRM